MLNNMSYILFINLNSISTGYVPQNPGRQASLAPLHPTQTASSCMNPWSNWSSKTRLHHGVVDGNPLKYIPIYICSNTIPSQINRVGKKKEKKKERKHTNICAQDDCVRKEVAGYLVTGERHLPGVCHTSHSKRHLSCDKKPPTCSLICLSCPSPCLPYTFFDTFVK